MLKKKDKIIYPPYRILLKQDDDISKYSARKKIALLFLKNQSKHYRSQEDIKIALSSAGMSVTQGTISKELKRLLLHPIEYKNKIYAICISNKGYCIQSQDDYPKNIRYVLAKQNLLAVDNIFYQHGPGTPQLFILWITNEVKKKQEAILLFQKILDGVYLDMFYIENRLIILLNAESDRFTNMSKALQNIFSEESMAYVEQQLTE